MNWQYIAGFFDGEGHVEVKGPARAIAMTQCDRGVLDEISTFLVSHGYKCGIYTHHRSDPEKWRPVSHLKVTSRRSVIGVLEGMRPWLIVKKQQAEDMLRFMKLYPPYRNADRSHCKHGHPLRGENLSRYQRPGTQERICLECLRRRSHNYYHGRKSDDPIPAKRQSGAI